MEFPTSVAKVIEVSASSITSFEMPSARDCDTIDNVRCARIQEQKVAVKNGRITTYG